MDSFCWHSVLSGEDQVLEPEYALVSPYLNYTGGNNRGIKQTRTNPLEREGGAC